MSISSARMAGARPAMIGQRVDVDELVERGHQPLPHRPIIAPAIVEGDHIETASVVAFEQARKQEAHRLFVEFARDIADANPLMAAPGRWGCGRHGKILPHPDARTGLGLLRVLGNRLIDEGLHHGRARAHAVMDQRDLLFQSAPVRPHHAKMQEVAAQPGPARVQRQRAGKIGHRSVVVLPVAPIQIAAIVQAFRKIRP